MAAGNMSLVDEIGAMNLVRIPLFSFQALLAADQ